MVGLSRFELLTPRLSSVCSNQLSYRPFRLYSGTRCLHFIKEPNLGPIPSKLDRTYSRVCRIPCQIDLFKIRLRDSRKEVIQPQVLLQLPCYDFTPITDHTLGVCLPCGLAQRLLVQPAFVM